VFRTPFLFALLVLASTTIPQVFQVVFGWVVKLEAWRRGAEVRIERIEGSFWEPVVLVHSYWSYGGVSGAVTRVEIARAEAQLSWKHLVKRDGERWFRRLSLRGVQGKIHVPFDRSPTPEAKASRFSFRLPTGSRVPLPDAVDIREIDFVFQSNGDHLRIEGGSFAASSMEAGELQIDRLTVRQPWLRRTFRNVQGKTALQDNRIALADVSIEPGVVLRSLNVAPDDLVRGQLDIAADFVAFDGTLKIDAAAQSAGRGYLFDASGTFGQINIAKLASFLAVSDAAGGIIKDGTFKFRGPPRDLSRAEGSLRFDATNFQWESRQWDSLAVGATLVSRRLQVPQLDLRQGGNELRISGEMALPGAGQRWWHGDFTANIDAKIGNLTELSALLLPEFKYAAGSATIEGSLRGRAQEFHGQLLVSGSKLTWRNAPIETLHAALKLNGKEVQAANIELVNGDDYLRGRGSLKFGGALTYWGELRASVEDLANYAAFLQKPVLPEPLAGGAIIDWTGEGSKEGHSGKFLARLRKVRTMGALAQHLHPINADIAASYGPGTMQFSRFSLTDDNFVFTTNIAVGNKALHLQNIRLTHRGLAQLEGDALLPLDVWQQWPNVSFSQLLTEEVVSRVQLTAHQLDLAGAAQLSGWKFPIAGTLDGTLTADGSIKALKLGGQLALSDGRIPLGWSGELLTNSTAKIRFDENAIWIDSLASRHAFGEVNLAGSIRLDKLLDPKLELVLKSPKATLPLFGTTTSPETESKQGVSLTAALDLKIAGPSSAATVQGTAMPLSLQVGSVPDIGRLWDESTVVSLPAAFSFPAKPWTNWMFDVLCQSSSPAPMTSNTGTFSANLAVSGTAGSPALDGELRFSQVGARAEIGYLSANPREEYSRGAAFVTLKKSPWWMPLLATTEAIVRSSLSIPEAVVKFSKGDSAHPSVDLRGVGSVSGWNFAIGATGPLNHLIRTYEGQPPLTDVALRQIFTGAFNPEAIGSAGRVVLELNPPNSDGTELGIGWNLDAAFPSGDKPNVPAPPQTQPN
jgi:hypothetical protein